MQQPPRQHIALGPILAAIFLLPIRSAWGQGLGDIRLTEISESGQWFGLKNTGSGPVDVSLAELCANFARREAGGLTVEAYDDDGDQNLILAAGEYFALQWDGIDVGNGDLALYPDGTGNFNNPEDIIDYVRWGEDSAGGREGVAAVVGIWSMGDCLGATSADATISFFGESVRANDQPDDWDAGTPTPAAPNVPF